MRVAFLGNAPWSVPSLEALAASGHDLVLVATREPRPAGRGGRPRRTPVAEAAERLGLQPAEIETAKGGPGLELLARSRPDVLAVVAYGEILPRAVLDIPLRAPVNVHFSLLPELRGAAPVQWAILRGMAATGVTTLVMDEGMDTGPILLQQQEAVAATDDAGSLGARLAAIGGRLLADSLDRLQAGGVDARAQDEARASHAPKLRGQDERIDWTEAAEAIDRRIRALAPTPGATTTYRGKVLKVFRAAPVAGEVAAGRIGTGTRDGIVVGAGEGAVAIQELAPEGKRRMSASEFVNGYRPEPGEALGP